MRAFTGIFTPLITPITPEEAPDLSSLHRLVQFQLDGGVHGLWAMGTSGEFAAFTEGERAEAIATVVEAAGGQVSIIANISAASTREAIQHGKRAAAIGVDAVAATPPYYYPHSQDELLTHFRKIRSAVDLPLYLYNIPQTVRVRLELATAVRLATEGTVAGIKDSQNDLEWFRQLVLLTKGQGIDFVAFAGTRHLIDAAVLAGGDGAIPSLANAFPDLCVAVYESAHAGDFTRSAELESRIVEIETLANTLTIGSRNAAVLGFLKAILQARGIIESRELTAPLRTPSDDEYAALMRRLEELMAMPV